MSIDTKIEVIRNIKNNIKNSINTKGGNVDNNMHLYSSAIDRLTTGYPEDSVWGTAIPISINVINGTYSGQQVIDTISSQVVITVTPSGEYLLPGLILVTNATYVWDKESGQLILSEPVGDIEVSIICGTELDAPFISISDDNVIITNVTEAESFDIYVDGSYVMNVVKGITTTSIPLATIVEPTGEEQSVTITVKSKALNKPDSVFSNSMDCIIPMGYFVDVIPARDDNCYYPDTYIYDGEDDTGELLAGPIEYRTTPIINTLSFSGHLFIKVIVGNSYYGVWPDWDGTGYKYIETTGGVSILEIKPKDSSTIGHIKCALSGNGSISCGISQCYLKDTPITLSDGSYKLVQDITYDDNLLVWDFDNAEFNSAKPLWIQKQKQALEYNHLVFSDGSELNTVNQHRIFNVEKGMFTYPMTDDTPLGTTTFNDKGEYITLVSKEVINKEVEYYNIITDYHMNLFTGTILTSCRLSNLYPIVDMQYVKDNRELHNPEIFNELDDKWVKGLRLLEQPLDINRDNAVVFENSLVDYVKRLEKDKA